MDRTLIKDLKEKIDKQVKIQGFVSVIRDLKKIMFIVMRDQSGEVQVYVDKENKEFEKIIQDITLESALMVSGKITKNPTVKLGGLEIKAKEIVIENKADFPLPINLDPNETPAGLEKRLDWRFLDLRRPEHLLIFKVQTTAEQAMREFWTKNGFVEIHSPKLMGSASESGGELFTLDYFGKPAYLAQSPQFYKQMAIAAGFDRVFEIGPVFRANPSRTSRHDTEFTSVDVEMSWIGSHEDVMSFEEKWLQYVLEKVSEKHIKEIKDKFGLELVVPKLPFPRLKMSEAVAVLKEMNYTVPPEIKGDLDPQGERLLGEYVKKKFDHEFVFVIDYGISIRPFYHMRHEDNSKLTKSFDLLWKGLEITTGAQREHRYDVLIKQAKEKGLSLEPMDFYLDMFKYGTPPHGGFGFGLTRMLMVMLDLKNVREATYLYRGINRLKP